MRVLVDGNNLMFALADRGVDAGRSMLTELLGRYADSRDVDVTVVFDGRAPRGGEARRLENASVSAHYSAGRTADEVMADLIGACSAPRNMTVVSSDRAVRRSARRRRCPTVDAATFAAELTRPPDEPPPPAEPGAKRHGLDDGQLEHWLEQFGMTPHDDPGPRRGPDSNDGDGADG